MFGKFLYFYIGSALNVLSPMRSERAARECLCPAVAKTRLRSRRDERLAISHGKAKVGVSLRFQQGIFNGQRPRLQLLSFSLALVRVQRAPLE